MVQYQSMDVHAIANLLSNSPLPYGLIFLGMLIEGNAAMLVVGFLISTGNFNPYALVITALAGSTVEQFFWFWFGKRLKNSSTRIAKWIIDKSNHFDEHFLHRPKTTLLLTKFIYGVHRAAVARAGVIGINGKTYAKHILPIMLFWLAVMGVLGYALSKSFALLNNYIRYAELIVLGVVLLILILQRIIFSGKLKEIWRKL